MTASAWITQAQPEAPERLVARVREVLETNPSARQLDVAEALIEAADALLRLVLRDDDARPTAPAPAPMEARARARERALDLLAADACVTWALEVAADDPGTLNERARSTMRRLEQAVA